ncbi:hypothetical protein VIBNISOn1_1480005 [Vibrio nigripulchritudo SOn1]|uniref:Uncharacterized protein n=1 Tax=Vibrio nigripulchritudo SOn1 TaxID=1238450 RepID=A0AAV2VL34_9VIBR|nr:hypothetical protein [Vibrio nigripulchritudo]CCO45431.1 hypothetical protein VIBNISOn1_1480005 [Vibrio nigripulchritudo SOn1]
MIRKNSPRNDELTIVKLLPLKLALMSALRELEITLMPIKLLVAATGELNEILVIPKEIAFNGKERPVLLNEELKQDIETYLKVLMVHGVARMPHGAYMGFDPNAALIVNSDLKPYSVQSRGQLTSRARIVPDELNKHLDSLICNAGLDRKGITRKSLIRTFVIQAIRAKWSLDDIALIAGMSKTNVSNIAVMDLDQHSPIRDYFNNRERRKEQKIKRLEQIRRWTFLD